MATRRISIEAVKDPVQLVKLLNALDTEMDAVRVLLNTLRTETLTRCLGPANFEIRTDFDIQNGDGFNIMVNGEIIPVATDQEFDTGTETVIATNAYWAAAILSIDDDGTTGHVDWGAEAASEALALANLASITPSGDVVCGYVAVHAKAANDLVAGTDALTGGTGGQVAQATSYYNQINIGIGAIASGVTEQTSKSL
jgi:hypothetical protein